ncbi:MAG: ATP-binding protein [Bacilli bacterium]|nr:ATP-binding protein [Bacilli bacterium]
MKQLLILSGKGGTGKTTVASALIQLTRAKVYADCDVDAPNLHLLMAQKEIFKKTDYYALPKAQIDINKCISCDICRQNCKFEAIIANEFYYVDPFACEGCGVCEVVCPMAAITFHQAIAGDLMLYKNDNRNFSTAQLKMGSGTSGKLVSEVKKQMKEFAIDADLAIIDGSPGIGCPVIASLSGVDMVLIVAEPSISGRSDMERIIKTAKQFKTKIVVCINKFDLNLENTKQIELFCQKQEIPMIGKIPFDKQVIKAVNKGQTIVDIECLAGKAMIAIYEQLINSLKKI